MDGWSIRIRKRAASIACVERMRGREREKGREGEGKHKYDEACTYIRQRSKSASTNSSPIGPIIRELKIK